MRNFLCLSAPTTLFFSALSSRLLCCVRGVKFLRLFVAFCCIGWGHFVFAAYTFKVEGSASYVQSGPFSSLSALKAANSSQWLYGPGQPDNEILFASMTCNRNASSNNISGCPYNGFKFYISRVGTCEAPNVNNPETGECEAPEPEKCEPTVGKRIPHWHNFGTLGAQANEAPITVCEDSCQYSNTFETPECSRNFPDKAFCSLTYLGNGVECTEGDASNPSNFDQPPTKPPVDPKPERSHEQKCEDWVTGEDGVARRTCTSKDEYKDSGKLKCENTNGYLKCAPGTPPPAYTKTETTAETAKTDNADGSSKTETTTNKDVTNCHGTKPCKTDSTETKETDNKNPDGSPGDKTTTCKGDKCTAEEDPKPGTDPDAEEEGEEKEESSVTGGTSCDSAPVCKGDAIQCAILRQEFTQRCADEKFREVTPENTNALKTDLDAAFSGEQFQPITATAENTFSLEGMIDTTSRFSSSCPVLPSVSYSWLDGSSQSFNPNFADLCQYLRWMGFLLVAFSMRSAAEIIAGGLK